MSVPCILRFDSLVGESVSWVFGEQHGKTAFNADGKIGVLQENTTNEACVLLPGSEVLLPHTRLPGRRRSQLMAAVPYSIEDALAVDVDACCYAVSRDSVDGAYSVACIDQPKFDALLRRLANAGIRPTSVVPDLLAIPYTEGNWSLLVIDESILLRTGRQSGFATEVGSLPLFLRAAVAEAGAARPSLLDIYVGAVEEAAQVVRCAAELGLTRSVHVHSQGEAFGWFESTIAAESGLDFLECRSEFSGVNIDTRQLRLVGALVGLWLLIVFATEYWDYRQLRVQSARLQVSIEEVFRSVFPEVRRIVNPRQQMTHQLELLRGSSGEGSAFLPLLTIVSRELADFQKMQILNVTYARATLYVDVQLTDLAELDEFKQRLRRQGVAAEVVSATNQDRVLRGRLRIQAKPEL